MALLTYSLFFTASKCQSKSQLAAKSVSSSSFCGCSSEFLLDAEFQFWFWRNGAFTSRELE